VTSEAARDERCSSFSGGTRSKTRVPEPGPLAADRAEHVAPHDERAGARHPLELGPVLVGVSNIHAWSKLVSPSPNGRSSVWL
jgi:hypothetical protein